MRRYGSCLLLALVGAAVLRVSLFSELYLRYVQPALRPCLIVSGTVLVLLAAAMAVVRRRSARSPEGQAHEEHHHGHSHSPARPRVAWLLTLPALALLLFPPPALGSYSAGREAAQRAAQGVGTFPALPAGDPVALTVAEFSSRAIYDSGRSLKGRTVRLTGFVTHGDDGAWYVTRLVVTCCAADATTGKVEIRGADDEALPADTWVTVTGVWRPKGKLGSDAAWPPVLDAATVQRVKQPADPYEKP
ncbi:TIGR03943 family protein [Streptomyces sp. NBC_01275]|uniref:TIGR03943 family putative permease subunit n=1 Tax=Streptomyces sp. NBC_01275 TaxID=2903807 RepID=UPI00225B10FF|nr:TIGR03943 family protein [Streptomyces sp. NBC_01275]MCX4763554.1 TIGR03943 family protein [Streptomyces sp. NBC_01275]